MTDTLGKRQHPSGNLLLEIGAASAGPFDRAFESHLNDAHDRPCLLGSRSFVRVPQWAGVGTGSASLMLHELDVPDHAAHVHAEKQTQDPTNCLGPMTCRAYRELGAPSGPHTHEIGSAILHVQVIVDPKYDDLFLHWYVNEHVPAVLDAPGMIAARRFEQIHPGSNADPHNRPRVYRTLYEMAEASVIRQPETLEASVRGACPAELEPHRQASNQVYAEVFQQTEAR